MENSIEIDLSGENEFDIESLLQSSDADAGEIGFGTDAGEIEFDTESLLQGSAADGVSPNDVSLMGEVEKFLLDENVDTELAGSEDFFSDLLAELSEGVEDGPVSRESDQIDPSLSADTEDEDPISKKQRRQMRNRDSAMKSRERKKVYLKDLEMKSKCLESECRRLGYALQCCEAENFALRHRLLNESPIGASTAKQESAVLFVESLLLGSLLWLVSTVCLFPMPRLHIPNQKDASRRERGLALEVVGTERLTTERAGSELMLDLVAMRRRCRGVDKRADYNMMKWGVVCKPKNKGGAEVINLKSFNRAMLAKWWWRV